MKLRRIRDLIDGVPHHRDRHRLAVHILRAVSRHAFDKAAHVRPARTRRPRRPATPAGNLPSHCGSIRLIRSRSGG